MLRCVYMMLLGIPISVSAVTLMKKLPMSSLVLMVVGAGRGPLVRASLQAAEETGRKLRVYAVEKNPNAIVTLHGMNDRVVPPSMTDFVQRLLPRGDGA